MAVRSVASFNYQYEPPFPWRGPRPLVEATRFDRMTNVNVGRGTIAVDAGEWLIESEDGSLVTMTDRVFRRWYAPVDRDARQALDRNQAFPQGARRIRPKRPKHKRGHTNQGLLKL